MVLRAKYLSDDGFGPNPEQPQEDLVCVGDPPVRCAAQNHIALRIEQALVTTLAVLKPCIGGLELPRKLGQLLGSPGKILGLAAQRKNPQQQKSDPTCHDAAQEQ